MPVTSPPPACLPFSARATRLEMITKRLKRVPPRPLRRICNLGYVYLKRKQRTWELARAAQPLAQALVGAAIGDGIRSRLALPKPEGKPA